MSTIYRLQFLFIAAAAILAAVCPANAQTTQAPNTPGPSARLFAAPFYRCARNFYVDATYGNDANAGTEDAPWQNIQTADATVQAGDCVNVQPGNYGSGAYITQGGNAPRPRGYVVYRCSQLDACKITGGGGPGGTLLISGPNGVGPGFVVIDGFEITVNSQDTYGMGIQVSDTGDFRTAPGAHHIWLLNNIIHGNGQ